MDTQDAGSTVDTVRRYWHGDNGVRMINPAGDSAPISGFQENYLKEMCPDDPGGVCDFGCGTGRLSKYYTPENYMGVDVNPYAIHRARQQHPDYVFQLIPYGYTCVPYMKTYLCWTVLLHIPDMVLRDVLCNFQDCRVFVYEVMDSKFGSTTSFQREPERYVEIFTDLGFHLLRQEIVTPSGGYRHGFQLYTGNPNDLGIDPNAQ